MTRCTSSLPRLRLLERQPAESGHCRLSPSVIGGMTSGTCLPQAAAVLACRESHASHPIHLLQKADAGVLSFIPPGTTMHPKPRSKRKADRSANLGSTLGAGAPGKSAAPRSQPKSGELVHVPATIPAEQQQQLFGRPVDHSSFEGLGLAKPLADHLEELNFSTPTLIQRAAIPPLLVSATGRQGLVWRRSACWVCARLSTAEFKPATLALLFLKGGTLPPASVGDAGNCRTEAGSLQCWWLYCMKATAHTGLAVLSHCNMSVGSLWPQAAHAGAVYLCRLDVMRSSTLPLGQAKPSPTWHPWCTTCRWALPHLNGMDLMHKVPCWAGSCTPLSVPQTISDLSHCDVWGR